jgi:hypothetical protein
MDDTKQRIAQIAQTLDYDGLTFNQRKVLVAMSLPELREWSIEKKCEVVGISRRAWYYILQRPEFKAACLDYAKEILGHCALDALNHYIRLGISGDSGILEKILRDLGVLKTEARVANNASVTVNIANVEQKRTENTEKGLNRFGFTVRNSDSD